MNDEIVKAYLWENIIKMAFTPLSSNDQDTWLRCYSFSLPSFWGIPELPLLKGKILKVDNKHLKISYECFVDGHRKGNVLISLNSSGNLALMWNHDIDHHYFLFPNHKTLPLKVNRCSNYLRIVKNEMGDILDGLIFHPAVHQHIDLHIPDLIENNYDHILTHDVRIGGGISNPFLFLFQLRYQFCINKEKRDEEKTRLKGLFVTAFENKNQSISAGSLFGIAK